MSQLPIFVRPLPFVLYFLALLLGAWRFWNDWTVAEASMQFAQGMGSEFEEMRFMSRSNSLYGAVADVAYLGASAAILHVLIAIYDMMKGPEA
ncbi:hypothetical protein [Erythrobacter ani]|uniref:Uncharacterized protein n=1 Tax=Erythrobacter ani TaxID=2827235 RepID=A0ABS6SQS2_9SPHN|nr:hypothetical protein [Erythrobacter ani]MBV7266979.1 hypothetical protein [Erythrobacter ani]